MIYIVIDWENHEVLGAFPTKHDAETVRADYSDIDDITVEETEWEGDDE